MIIVSVVGNYVYVQKFRLFALAHCVKIAVITETHAPCFGNREIANRIFLEESDLFLAASVYVAFPNVKRTGTFLKIIIALAIGSPLRVAAFTGIVGKLFVSAFLLVKVRKPDVACYW